MAHGIFGRDELGVGLTEEFHEHPRGTVAREEHTGEVKKVRMASTSCSSVTTTHCANTRRGRKRRQFCWSPSRVKAAFARSRISVSVAYVNCVTNTAF